MIPEKVKAGPVGTGADLRKSVLANCSETNSSPDLAQALARSVFGRGFVVVHEPIGERFRKRAPSRIRSWRASDV